MDRSVHDTMHDPEVGSRLLYFISSRCRTHRLIGQTAAPCTLASSRRSRCCRTSCYAHRWRGRCRAGGGGTRPGRWHLRTRRNSQWCGRFCTCRPSSYWTRSLKTAELHLGWLVLGWWECRKVVNPGSLAAAISGRSATCRPPGQNHGQQGMWSWLFLIGQACSEEFVSNRVHLEMICVTMRLDLRAPNIIDIILGSIANTSTIGRASVIIWRESESSFRPPYDVTMMQPYMYWKVSSHPIVTKLESPIFMIHSC